MKQILRIFTIGLVLLMAVSVFAQEESQKEEDTDFDEGEVQELIEIEIIVEPELPTVISTISRQNPDIKETVIQSPLERMVKVDIDQVKPDLTKMKVSDVKDWKKMLATKRKR